MEARQNEPSAPAPRPANPPAFNVPAIVLLTIACIATVHLVRTQFLGAMADVEVILDFSFIAGCYGGGDAVCDLRAAGANLWSPISHAFLHGDWTHLAANALWLLAFGTPVARRLGNARFVLFMLIGAVAGAAFFYLLNPLLIAPMIGASGVVSAVMGAASRFALAPMARFGPRDVAFAPRLGLVRALTNRTVLFFVAVFFLTNLLIGSGIGSAFGGGLQIAWEAHLGGFAFGFLCFGAFDRMPPHAAGGLPR